MANTAAQDSMRVSLMGGRMIDLEPAVYGTHSLRRTKVSRKPEGTVRYLGIEVDDALEMSEQIDP